MQGQTEVKVLTDTFDNPLVPSIVVRPGGVFDSVCLLAVLNMVGFSISRDVLAAAIVSIGAEGIDKDENAPYQGRAVENKTLTTIGKAALQRYKI